MLPRAVGMCGESSSVNMCSFSELQALKERFQVDTLQGCISSDTVRKLGKSMDLLIATQQSLYKLKWSPKKF